MSQRLCAACNAPLVRRPDEGETRFALRAFCGKACWRDGRRAQARLMKKRSSKPRSKPPTEPEP